MCFINPFRSLSNAKLKSINALLNLFANAIVNGSNIGIHSDGHRPLGRIPANYVWANIYNNNDNDNDDDLELQEAIERSINER